MNKQKLMKLQEYVEKAEKYLGKVADMTEELASGMGNRDDDDDDDDDGEPIVVGRRGGGEGMGNRRGVKGTGRYSRY